MAALLKARPRALIESGRLNRRVMLREFMTYEEVLSQLRLHGIEDIAVVGRAYIEPNGLISVIRVDRGETEPAEPPVT
ncbi:YetF domain-containing protein [Microbispora sp. NPDC049633]|uniref:YetF domain-containing protein n=1 Tax=Microbispora sp. NPDC049633 TaxID=3154355 RepID=UPI0034194B57